jgi:copper chaperone CopZ
MAIQQRSNESAGPVVLTVGGMTCGGCAGAVSRALSQVPGVVEAQVDLAKGRATVTGSARPEDLIRAVEAAGFSGSLA